MAGRPTDSPMRIKLSDERLSDLAGAIQRFFATESDQDLSGDFTWLGGTR